METIKALLYDRGMTIAGVKKMIHDGELSTEVRALKSSANVTTEPQKKTPPINNEAIEIAIGYLEQARAILE